MEDDRQPTYLQPDSRQDSSGGSGPSDSATIVDRQSSRTGSVIEVSKLKSDEPPLAEKDDRDPFEVQFEPGDLENPHNWSRRKRMYMTAVCGLLIFNATFASSAPSGIVPQLEQRFGFGREVATLLIALFVAGYCVGPLLWGPLSEQFGRKPIFLSTFLVYTGFQVGCALSPNTGAILTFRFLGGVFAAAPLTNSGAVISDIWDANTRGIALAVFTLGPFAGPALAPIVSGFLAVGGASWVWVFWLLACFAGACFVLILFTLPETYGPVILARKAKRLRKETGDDRYWAPLDRQHVGFAIRARRVVVRPFQMLIEEPMLLALSVYMSFVYGCVYLLFEAYPIVFTEARGFNAGITGLMFLPIFLGGVLGVLGYLLIWNPRYVRAGERYKPNPVPPEYRLEQCMAAAPILAISFFWFGWTSYPSINYWAPMMAGLALGFSVIWIFLSLFNYIIDAYLAAAASALAANTVMRSAFGAGFPLFATQMYDQLNPRWASTLLGCIAILLAPIPFVLKKYGPALRRKSKFAPHRPEAEKPRDVESA
ncbi:MFS general substrate transporter [Panus rudis PR-1116 ss-1]|nr:MFS general substrate transporter [Panus rudis PR-1116 ss-1]